MGKKFTVKVYRAGEECFLSAEVDSLADARGWVWVAALGQADKYEVLRGARTVAQYTKIDGRWVRTHEEASRG